MGARWVPRQLKEAHKQARLEACSELLGQAGPKAGPRKIQHFSKIEFLCYPTEPTYCNCH